MNTNTNKKNVQISSNPGICFGKPRLVKHRLAIEHVLDYVNAGATNKEIIAVYPFLTEAEIRTCVEYDKVKKSGSKNRNKIKSFQSS